MASSVCLRITSEKASASPPVSTFSPGLEGHAYAVDAEVQAVAERSPAHGLHDLAEALHAAAVVVGSSHR